MTTAALNNLWAYLQTLSLTKKNREWLADRLIDGKEKKVYADETEYISSSQAMLDIIAQGDEDIKNGRYKIVDTDKLWK